MMKFLSVHRRTCQAAAESTLRLAAEMDKAEAKAPTREKEPKLRWGV
jgi:hypothetical protein